MLIFFDTEFTELSNNAKFISIGLIDETGKRSFYAELADTWNEDEVSEFVALEVLPKLGERQERVTLDELRRQLADWLGAFQGSVQLASDSVSWDWIWIFDIFGEANGKTWPKNLAQRPYHVPNGPIFTTAVERIFATTPLRRHHALDDAMVNRLAWLQLGTE
jgi:hypothetical protein